MKTILLIHGGMHGGWSWARIRPLLEKQGYQVLTPCLSGLGTKAALHSPSISLSTHIQDIVTLIDEQSLHDVVLVGHSYGALVATGAAVLRPKAVRQIIYIDGVLAEPGQSMATAIRPDVWESVNARSDGREAPALTVEEHGFKDKADQEFVEGKSTPQSLASFKEPLNYDPTILRRIPSLYIGCTQVLFLSNMKERAKKMGIDFSALDSGHFPMIEHPKELAKVLVSYIG